MDGKGVIEIFVMGNVKVSNKGNSEVGMEYVVANIDGSLSFLSFEIF